MAKNNLFLGNASGKIGDVVLYTARGQQIARKYNPSPHNPQTPIQLLQRVVLKTSSLGYSFLQAITDHSFQGSAPGTDSQSSFTKLNVAQMRLLLADYINSGNPDEILGCLEANFSASDASLPEMMPFVVSDGSLPQMNVMFVGSTTDAYGSLRGINALPANPTYADVCDRLGLKAGDQLTFLFLSCDDTKASSQSKFNGFSYARIILSPNDGDMTSAFFDTENFTVNKPNPRNEGSVEVQLDNGAIKFSNDIMETSPESANSLAAVAVIASRWSGSVWQRSRAQLVLRPYTGSETWRLKWDHGEDYMADAIASYQRDTGRSTRYLNQAGADF